MLRPKNVKIFRANRRAALLDDLDEQLRRAAAQTAIARPLKPSCASWRLSRSIRVAALPRWRFAPSPWLEPRIADTFPHAGRGVMTKATGPWPFSNHPK